MVLISHVHEFYVIADNLMRKVGFKKNKKITDVEILEYPVKEIIALCSRSLLERLNILNISVVDLLLFMYKNECL